MYHLPLVGELYNLDIVYVCKWNGYKLNRDILDPGLNIFTNKQCIILSISLCFLMIFS